MGFFDALLNPTPEQSAGLLGFATNFNNAIGGGNRPVNLGAAFAAGAQGMQQSRDQYQDRQRELQMLDMQAKLYGLKLQDAEGEVAGKQQQRERDARILKRLRGLQGLPTLGDGNEGQSGGGDPPSAPAGLAGYDTSYNGTPYTQTEAGDAMMAAKNMNGYEPDKLNQVMALTRQGMTAGQAASIVFGSGSQASAPAASGLPGPAGQQLPGMTDQGATPGPASVFAAGDGAQFPATMAMGMPGLPGLPKRGGAELMQGAQQPGGQQLPFLPPTMRQGGATARQNTTQAYVQRIMQQAEIYATEGDHEKAKALIQEAQKFRPKYANDFRQATGDDGKLRNYMVADDGSWMDTGLGVKPDLVGVDLGGTYEFVDKNNLQPGRAFQKTQTPNSRADDRRFAARGAAGGAGAGAEPSMNDETLDFLSDRALRGDRTAFQNLGRGAQGAANLVALNQRVAEKARAQGLTGADMAGINADYMGQSAGLRTSGTISARIENAAAEADQLAPLALAASEKVARSGLLPFGKAEIMFNKNTNDPALNQFATANIGLATAYAGAMARGGKATVSDMEHAREILSTAKNHTAYKAIVSQLQLEIEAAMRAPQHVRENLRGQISGRSGGHDTPKVPNPMAPAAAGKFTVTAPNGKTYDFPDAKSMNNFKLSTGIK